jgi:hypothetical protein
MEQVFTMPLDNAPRKIAFSLTPASFPFAKGFFYPCLCLACRPRARRKEVLLQPLKDFMAPRIGAPMPRSVNRSSSDGLLELYTPSACRKHTGRDTVTLRATPDPEIRRKRVLAFIYRCMLKPEDADAYIASSYSQPWLPVPAWNLKGHDLDLPLVRHVREKLTDAGFPVPLCDLEIYAPHVTPAALAVHYIDEYEPGLFPGLDQAKALAMLCAADGACGTPDPLIRAIATRVAFNPYPLDPYPWAPRWGPATKDIDDHVTVPHGLGTHYELRRWWNFNGPMIRPDAFPAGAPADTHHRELLKPYRLPLMTDGWVPRHVNHLTR